jgi:hypothetical protein
VDLGRRQHRVDQVDESDKQGIGQVPGDRGPLRAGWLKSKLLIGGEEGSGGMPVAS